MKLKGKSKKSKAGMAPFDRLGLARYGDKYNEAANQFVGFIKVVMDFEADDDKEVRDRAPGWWQHHIFPRLQSELRNAISKNDGAFFTGLGDMITMRGQSGPEPLRAWFCTLSRIVNDTKGTRNEQLHRDKTYDQLREMFTESKYGYDVRKKYFEDTARELGIQVKKLPKYGKETKILKVRIR